MHQLLLSPLLLNEMILLDKNDYEKVREPLMCVGINNLFARAVVEKQVDGKIYVDNVVNPETFYVLHGYGMSLLFGRSDNRYFNNRFKDYALNTSKSRKKPEWMQAYPSSWDHVLRQLLAEKLVSTMTIQNKDISGIIELSTRVNFTFNHEKFVEFQSSCPADGLDIRRSGPEIYHEMKGSVVPKYFWENAEKFLEHGAGFSLYHKNQLACTAYSAFVIDHMLELGIETIEEFRGNGYAQHTCAALIEYCIEKGYEPVWACKLENIGSYKLAQKIGFESSVEIPYYGLAL